MWFAFVKSPLGTNVRVSKAFIADVNSDKEDELLKGKLCGVYEVEVLDASILDNLYATLVLDPDIADYVRLGVKLITVARAS